MTRAQLASAQNDKLQAFTILPESVKNLLKANRDKTQKFTKDRQWVTNPAGTFASNGIYRINPVTRTDAETVTFALRDNGSGDFRAVDPDGRLSGYTTLAHLVAKRGFKQVTYRDYRGVENKLTALNAAYGVPISVTFDASAL